MESVVITIHSAETSVFSEPYCRRPPIAVDAALTRSIRFRVPWFSTHPAVAIRQFEEYGVSSTGRRLGITERTARFHVSAILEKLGVTDRTAAVAKAFDLGLLHAGRR
jgi:hypothetical protein